jgi:hypothetical protein
VRIAAQLIDATSGAHLWADRFDGSLEEVFELQDKVAFGVAGVVESTVQTAEIGRSAGRPTTDLTTYDLYLRAQPNCFSWDKERLRTALDLLERAIERDPHFGPALALAANCHHHFDRFGGVEDPQAHRHAAIAFARRALQASPDDPSTIGNVAFVLGSFGGDIEPAIALGDRARAQPELRSRLGGQRLSEAVGRTSRCCDRAFGERMPPQPTRGKANIPPGHRRSSIPRAPLRGGGRNTSHGSRGAADSSGNPPLPRFLLCAYGMV